MNLGKYSFGIGDRFGHQGEAQLKAFFKALDRGVEITPVWNKSNREHQITGTHPSSTKLASDQAVLNTKWKLPYFIDADHINLSNVDEFLKYSNFFTIDVANFIGKKSTQNAKSLFLSTCKNLSPKDFPSDFLEMTADKFLHAITQAGIIYNHILTKKGNSNFVTEISMDEVDFPQTPKELYIILKMIAQEKIPIQTIAPKFSGQFNKGVDYVGDLQLFEKEFEEDILIIEQAIKDFNLPPDLKLSVHSGSDKFSLYPIIRKVLKKHNKGIHIKTAGTTWLEELIGLSLSDRESVDLVKKIYTKAFSKKEELCEPYKTVIRINPNLLPIPEEVNTWPGQKIAGTLTHNPIHPDFNSSFRQLLHVGYKIAAELGKEYNLALEKNAETIGLGVSYNLYERHIKPIFLD